MEPKTVKPEQLEIQQAVRNNPRIMEYLKKYQPDDAERFINHYAEQKLSWYEHGENRLTYLSNQEERWTEEAERHIRVILQKKLFDAQCLWRAEQVQFDEIEITIDFDSWERRILDCPFIDLDENDVELYQGYLLNNPNAELDVAIWGEWQSYDSYKDHELKEDTGMDLPEWYQHHNVITGSGALLRLPDIRGEKEAHYQSVYRKVIEGERELTEQTASTYVPDNRPYLAYYDPNVIAQFVVAFEDPLTIKYFKANERLCKWNLDEEMEGILELLLEADEPVPLKANSSWLKSIRLAEHKYRIKKIVEALPDAYLHYRTFRDIGIDIDEDEQDQDDYGHWDSYAGMILGGREISGEPRDFNF